MESGIRKLAGQLSIGPSSVFDQVLDSILALALLLSGKLHAMSLNFRRN